MTSPSIRLPLRARRRIALGLAALALLAAALVAGRSSIQRAMAGWTGEEALGEQIKGTLALVYLRLAEGVPDTEPLYPMAHSGLNPYGINTFLEQEAEPAKVEQSIRLISEAGFHWIRQQFPWQDIEISAKGDYWDYRWDKSAWEKYDHIVATAEQYGVEIIARLDTPPAWSRSVGDAEGWTLAPPDDYEDYGDFVYTVVSRYKGRIHYYQIWNEPNIYPEWGDQPADAAAYTRLLQVAYRRAKEADPDCVIIAAGLAQTTEETPAEFGPRNVSDLLYLEQMYAAGAQGYFDIMGAQVYGLWTSPYDRRAGRQYSNFSRVQLLREIMVRHGDADKPIWATEVGWNAQPEDLAAAANFGRVSEAQQAEYAVAAYARAAQEWPWLGVMNYWFFRRATDSEQDQPMYYFRAMEPDFTPLPVWGALSTMATEDPTVSIGFYQENHWALDYAGGWQTIHDSEAVQGAYLLGQEGDELSFTFEGTDLKLVLREASQANRLAVTVDGEIAAMGRVSTAPYTDAPAVSLARNLADGRHRVTMRVYGGPVGLDGLVVTRRAMSLQAVVALAAGGATLLAALLGWRVRLRRRRRAAALAPAGRDAA